HLLAGAVDQPAHADQRCVADHHAIQRALVRLAGHQKSISMNHSAANASITITIEIDCTTLEVVRSPSDCAVPWVCRPSRQPISAITIANTGALTMPTTKCRTSIISCMRAR